jgi:eukaryotic-like serine/threonine-protein kinase
MENPLELPTPPTVQPVSNAPPPTDLTGRTLGDFQLIRRLGQGGMGHVYLARQLSLKRQVAVKILRTDLAANVTALQRFQQEAEAVARITHANIVQVYSIDQDDGLHYMALEYVEGRNLRDFINRKGPPDLAVALTIMRQVAAALQRASELGFVHRDIKPENILLTKRGEVKVADFGLSRCFDSEQPLNITQSGVTMGTPLYMSPEQVQGHAVDPRSDIYSFGITCYHMLAGEPPFKGQTPFEVALQHVQNEALPLTEIRPDLPADLCAVVHKMMAKKPEHRYQTGREVLRDLNRLKDSLATTAQPAIAASGAMHQATRSNAFAISGNNGALAPPAAARSSWRRWALGVAALLCAGSVGAALHWKTAPSGQPKLVETETDPADRIVDPDKALEKQLSKRLDEKNIKSDLEVTNAMLEFAMIGVRGAMSEKSAELKKKRFDETLHLFDLDSLRKRPALVEAKNFFAPTGQYFPIMSALGKGIVLSYQDRYEESNAEFKKIMAQKVDLKPKQVRTPIEAFLWKYDRWKRLVADALDRNAKNMGVKELEEPLNRHRMYSPKIHEMK